MRSATTSGARLLCSDTGVFLTLVLLFGLLIVALTSPILFGRVAGGDDLGNMHLPFRSIYQEALQGRQSVLWSPQLYAGLYLHAEGQAGMYHPIHWLLYTVLPLGWAFTLEFVLSYAVMCPGMYLFLRRLRLPRGSALFGAMVFTFSGFNLLHFMHMNAIAVVAHIPWLLLATDLVLRSTDRRQIALAQLGISLGTGSQLLLGHPQLVWLSVVSVAALTAWRLGGMASPWRLGLLACAMGLGVLLGAIQLLPTIQALGESERGSPSLAFRLTYSLHPANLLQLVSPYALRGRVVGGNVQEFGLYNGAVCSVALGWLLLRWRALGRWRSLVLSAVAFASVMLLLSFGASGGLYLLVAALPGVGLFRAPARYILLVHLALAIVAAVMMTDLMRLTRERGRPRALRGLWPLAVVAALSLVTLGARAWITAGGERHPWAVHLWPFAFAILGSGFIVTASVLVAAAARGVRWAPWCLAVFTVADLSFWGLTFVWRDRPQPLEHFLERLPPPPADARSARIHVTGGMDWLSQDLLVMKGYRLASGYVGLRPRRALSPEDLTVRRLLGIKWVFSGGRWAEVPDPLPRVRMVIDARVTEDVASDLPRIDVTRTALVGQAVGELGPGADGTARIVNDAPGFVEVRTSSTSRQLLVLSEAYHSGWKATEDDHPIPIYRAYRDLQASVVSPGSHRIVFRFDPQSFRWGQRLSGGALVLVMVTFVACLGRRSTARP
jgi:hypothetical protein